MASIQIFHEYFAGPWKGLSFQPDRASFEAIQKNQLQFRCTSEGFFVSEPSPENIPDLSLIVFAYPMDNEYAYYTDLPARGTIMHYKCSGGLTSPVYVESSLNLFPGIQAHKPPCMVIELKLGTGEYQNFITLKSKALHWKYILNPSFPSLDVEIVDVAVQSNPMIFEKSTDTDGSTFWITADEITLSAQPAQRFQLREGKTGKVILKRLPCANGRMITKEVTADGRNVHAAEVYINP